MNDPWKHRSFGMTCHTCMWYAPKKVFQMNEVKIDGKKTNIKESVDGPIGRCRRHAPTMNGYPVVYPKDWCGDHKLNENRVVSDIVDEERVRDFCRRERELDERDKALDEREKRLGLVSDIKHSPRAIDRLSGEESAPVHSGCFRGEESVPVHSDEKD